MIKTVFLLCILTLASAECPWDYLNTLAGKLTDSHIPINLCQCYENGMAVVQNVQ